MLATLSQMLTADAIWSEDSGSSVLDDQRFISQMVTAALRRGERLRFAGVLEWAYMAGDSTRPARYAGILVQPIGLSEFNPNSTNFSNRHIWVGHKSVALYMAAWRPSRLIAVSHDLSGDCICTVGATPVKIVYTYHAKRRMIQRKVTPEQVEEALAWPDYTLPGE